jgi:phosphoglycolate phosphatase-like HAD superfamily hydrolase
MKQSNFPPGWDEQRVRKVIAHYEAQTEDEAVAEDEAMLQDQSQAVMEIPMELVPIVRELIAKHHSKPIPPHVVTTQKRKNINAI